MAKIVFFLGANPDLKCSTAANALNEALQGRADFPESLVDQMATLAADSEDAADACCESGERIYTMECDIDSSVDPDAAQEALTELLFEGGRHQSLGDSIRVVSIG